MKIEFELNRKIVSEEVFPTDRLLDLLRDKKLLKGTKEGCGEGECGACMILLDNIPVNSCLVAAGSVHGRSVLTIEGLRDTPHFNIIESSLIDAGAVQCGFCTPGFIMSIYSLLMNNSSPDDEEIKQALSGNLCRCTGYNMIQDGVKLAIERGKHLWQR